MNDTVKLLDRLAASLGDASDYRIAQVLGINKATVSRWRVGKGSFSDETALKVAELLHENPGYLLAVAAGERATDEQARKAWGTAAKVLRRSAAAVVAIAMLVPAPQAEASQTRPGAGVCILCYIRRMARFVRFFNALPTAA